MCEDQPLFNGLFQEACDLAMSPKIAYQRRSCQSLRQNGGNLGYFSHSLRQN